MIADNIKYYCKAAGITLGELATRLQITRQTLHAITTTPATVKSLEKIAAALNVPAWKLMHPDPASLEDNAGPGFICPRCGTRLIVTAAPDASRPESDNHHPDALQDEATQAGENPPTPGKLF